MVPLHPFLYTPSGTPLSSYHSLLLSRMPNQIMQLTVAYSHEGVPYQIKYCLQLNEILFSCVFFAVCDSRNEEGVNRSSLFRQSAHRPLHLHLPSLTWSCLLAPFLLRHKQVELFRRLSRSFLLPLFFAPSKPLHHRLCPSTHF